MTGDFEALTAPWRREVFAHCYRLVGATADAEDLVQETYLRAWRGFERFEGRASVRRWLHAIATTVCLSALETRPRRPLPSGLAAPFDDHRVAVAEPRESVPWLQPAPDRALGVDDPATVAATRATVRLAIVAALQLLPARQRAVLTLRDVLAFTTAEVAAMLETTPDAVDALLRRARRHLADAAPVPDDLVEPPDRRTLLDDYVEAFTRADPDALVALLRADVELEMPPIPSWFSGRDAVVGFLAARVLGRGRWTMRPTGANGQPALVVHRRTADAELPYGVQVLTLAGGRIARITSFNDPSLVGLFAPDDQADAIRARA
ncbi:RNA polymerase sigma factor [Actinomycetospora sp. NBRC 106375]|uniref:RNA polymerase subunit sigma-70 n=1 Tax=Actinomycetospora sp. NBRC 106375 TaxID=3032207 RepID=UPI00249FC747|nr:RNA polymerase subunit sigma-70 [Actinomycetospora sp. NBRC 106375]GLZ49676.1 RNA polymerase sigma factor [Actinomycetospora sp. NBRC 106375]